LAHRVWEQFVKPNAKLVAHWKNLVKKVKPAQARTLKEKGIKTDPLNQNDEELFCMAYAATFAKQPTVVFHNKEWIDFIKNLSS
jgi:hypothetical protein